MITKQKIEAILEANEVCIDGVSYAVDNYDQVADEILAEVEKDYKTQNKLTPNEFLKTEANPDDVIAITCNADWELTHLENLLEEYHQAKLKLFGIGIVSLHCPKCKTLNVVEDNNSDLIWCYECEECYDR